MEDRGSDHVVVVQDKPFLISLTTLRRKEKQITIFTHKFITHTIIMDPQVTLNLLENLLQVNQWLSSDVWHICTFVKWVYQSERLLAVSCMTRNFTFYLSKIFSALVVIWLLFVAFEAQMDLYWGHFGVSVTDMCLAHHFVAPHHLQPTTP